MNVVRMFFLFGMGAREVYIHSHVNRLDDIERIFFLIGIEHVNFDEIIDGYSAWPFRNWTLCHFRLPP